MGDLTDSVETPSTCCSIDQRCNGPRGQWQSPQLEKLARLSSALSCRLAQSLVRCSDGLLRLGDVFRRALGPWTLVLLLSAGC